MPQLKDKTAVITGASRGIGKAIALAYAREGAKVIVNYCQSKNNAAQVVEEITAAGGKAQAIQADVSEQQDIERLINEAGELFGNIDIWVNNAGADILTGQGAQLDDSEKLARLIAIDLQGTINCCWAVVPLMQQQGRGAVINMSWDLAMHGLEGRNPQMFAAVKAGILGYSRSLAKTYGPEVRINILAPGWIETTFAEDVMPKDYYQARINEIPLARFGTPEDVAEAAVFLASDNASYMTGEVIKINGGLI